MENIETNKIIWYDGIDNYKFHTLILNQNKQHEYVLELLDKPIPENNRKFTDIVAEILDIRKTKIVEILYSGGLDSEMILKVCQLKNIPVTAVTMRLMLHDYPINTHDLYYSEKYCRENKINQTFVDLDIKNFYENGVFVDYLLPYNVTIPHVATHFWLLEQCNSFPIISGDYSWPWCHKPLLSPHKYHFSIYNKFLKDNNIDGIGNLLNYSLELNKLLIETHLEIQREKNINIDQITIPAFKREVIYRLGLGDHELRLRSYGWEAIPTHIFNVIRFKDKLVPHCGTVKSSIKWNDTINNILGGDITINDQFTDLLPNHKY